MTYTKATTLERARYRHGVLHRVQADGRRLFGDGAEITFADLFPPEIKGRLDTAAAPIYRIRIVVEAVLLPSPQGPQLTLADRALLDQAVAAAE